MFAALSWLLDLDESRPTASTSSTSHAINSSSNSSSNSRSSSRSGSASGSASDDGARALRTGNRQKTATAARTFAGSGGQPVAELRVATAATADPAIAQRRPVYGSPRLSDASFADLAARKASLFGTTPPPTPASHDDPTRHDALAPWREGRGLSAGAALTTASSGALRTVPLWCLSAYATEAVRLSPMPSPAPPPEPLIYGGLSSATAAAAAVAPLSAGGDTDDGVDERVLLQREGVQLSACFGSAHRASPPRPLADDSTTVPAAAAHASRPRRTTASIAPAPTHATPAEDREADDEHEPTPEARILAWDADVRARRTGGSLPPSQPPGETADNVAACRSTDTAGAEARLVQRAMKAALLVATPTPAAEHDTLPVDLAAAPEPAVVRLHPSNPFLASATVDLADGGSVTRHAEATAYAPVSEDPLPVVSLAPVWARSGEAAGTDVHAFMADALRRRSAELMRGAGPASAPHSNSDADVGVVSVTPMAAPHVSLPLPAATHADTLAKGKPLYDFTSA